MPARTISRFGRSYIEFDPDGAGAGGPSTWILTTPGAGASGGIGSKPSGVFTPVSPTATVAIGAALYFKAPGVLDLALAADSGVAGSRVHPYQVAGLAANTAVNGALVSLITDGQVTMADWTALVGTADLDVGQRYYLSELRLGGFSVTPPTALGATVVSVGQAISQRTLEVEINVMVRL